MASKAAKNRKPAKTNARAAKTAPATNNRPHVATRSPIEQLTQMCAQQANRSKGQVQQEWFALGSWVAQFTRLQQQAESTAATVEAPRAMAAGA